MANKLTFLFGAGISIKAELPTGEQLTSAFLTNDKIYQATSAFGMLSANQDDLYTEDCCHYQKILVKVYKYLSDIGIRNPNYENLYDAVQFLHNVSSGDAFSDMNGLIAYFNSFVSWELDFSSIQKNKNTSLCYFKNMLNYCQQHSFDEVHFFTLNHDLLLETALKENGITYADGFGLQDGDVRYWQPQVYSSEKFKLYKPHGSIDWWELNGSKVQINGSCDHLHLRDRNGKLLDLPSDFHPHFLTGTTTKIGLYKTEPHRELLNMFVDELAKTDRLIVSGYSYGDKGINAILLAWQVKNPNAEIINISESKEYEGLGLRVEHKDKWFNEFTEDDWNNLGL